MNVKKRNKPSLIHPILGQYALVCSVYMQVTGKLKKTDAKNDNRRIDFKKYKNLSRL